MSINAITTIYSGDERENALLKYADDLSSVLSAKSSCLHITPEVDAFTKAAFTGTATIELYEKYISSANQDLKTKARISKENFAKLSLKNLNWENETGSPSSLISYLGKFSDIILLHKNIEDFNQDYLGVTTSAIFETARPVIIFPDSYKFQGIKNISIAWDGSLRSARAIKSAIPILKQTENVFIITVDEAQKDTSSINDLQKYLLTHEIKSTHKNISKVGRCIGDEIIKESEKVSSEMIIMGAYTHNKIRQSIFGGVTKFILSNAPMPVFLEH
jgi:nucleotide-binding universal stress UspA family protein